MGKAMRLQHAYEKIFISNGGPIDAAVLTNNEHDFENYDYYFSPEAMRIAGDLVIASGGVPCSRPRADSVNLTVGHSGYLARLAREEDKS